MKPIPKEDSEICEEITSNLISKNLMISGRRTSVKLEPEMWSSLYDAAAREGCTIHNIASLIYMRRKEGTSLTSAVRTFLLLYYRAASTEHGHQISGHGSFERMAKRAAVPLSNILK